MSKIDEKLERLVHANAVIAAMSRHGRRFFYSKTNDTTAALSLDKSGRVRLTDEYTQKTFLIVKNGRWRHFSNGGTLRSLIEALAGYVRTGQQVNPLRFGPFPDYLCDGDLWGYGDEAMEAVRADIADNPAVAPRVAEPKEEVAA
jgi:hypothetical protein